MILDETEFAVAIKVPPLSMTETHAIMHWALCNNFAVKFSFGNIYFKEVEHATLFRLRFGL